VALEPARFFRHVKTGESGSAVLFGLLGFTLGGWLSVLFSYFTAAASFGALEQLLRRMEGQGVDPQVLGWVFRRVTLGSLFVQMLVLPVFGLVAIYLVSGLLHLVLLALRGAPRGFDATVTVVGYAFGLYLIQGLPFCGGVIGLVWFAVAMVLGLAEAQRAPTWKSALAVAAPVLLGCLCACAAGAALASMLAAMKETAGGTSL
jgi:hypothetical protein